MVIPGKIQEQIRQIQVSDLDQKQLRAKYPEAVRWINENVDIVSILKAAGVELRPLSPDAPGVLMGSCPDCRGALVVKG